MCNCAPLQGQSDCKAVRPSPGGACNINTVTVPTRGSRPNLRGTTEEAQRGGFSGRRSGRAGFRQNHRRCRPSSCRSALPILANVASEPVRPNECATGQSGPRLGRAQMPIRQADRWGVVQPKSGLFTSSKQFVRFCVFLVLFSRPFTSLFYIEPSFWV